MTKVILASQLALSIAPVPTAIPHGQPATLIVSLSGTATSEPVSGLQFTVTLPVGWTINTAAIDPSLSQTKILSFNTVKNQNNQPSITCLIFGLNTIPLGSGPVAEVSLTGPIQTPPGAFLVPLTGVVAASPAGTQVPITGNGTSITVIKHRWFRRMFTRHKK